MDENQNATGQMNNSAAPEAPQTQATSVGQFSSSPTPPAPSLNNGNKEEPGHGAAVASMVLGILAIVFWFFGMGAILSLILGVIGLVMAANSKKAGFNGGIRTAGFVLSLLGLIGGAIALLACGACIGALSSLGHM